MSDAVASDTNTAVHTAETPQLLLEHHLKELRLPTILREYDKVARHVSWVKMSPRCWSIFQPASRIAALHQHKRR
jgi:hypothetical protein